MNSWEEVRLKELISEMGDGGTPSTTDQTNFGGYIPWAVVDDVISSIKSTKESLTEKGYKNCSAKKWPVGSVILTSGATIGQVGIAEIELCTKQGITGIIVNEYANPLFLKFWFEDNTTQLLRYAQGTTFKEIRPRTLGNLRIQIPAPFTQEGLNEQTAIATILSKVDEAIEATRHSIKQAEKLKKALMQNLLTGKLKPDGLESFRERTDDEFYEDDKFGKYPKDWNFSRFKDYAVLQRGKDLTDKEVVKGKYPVVKSNGVQIHHNQYFVEPPGVVTGRSGTIGKVFYIEEKFWSHNTSLYVKDFKGNNPKFIYFLIHRMDFRKYYAGTTVPTLNRNDIHRLKIAIPKAFEEQEEIANKIDEYDKLLQSKQTKIQTLQRLKKSLMQNLLTGKVRLDVEAVNKIISEQ